MKSEKSYISIIIPAYNEEKYLLKGLDMIQIAINKVNFPVEVIVVDNDSIDKTSEIAGTWGAKVVIEKEHNISKVRNRGVKEASGDIILTIDADSQMHSSTLEVVHQIMEQETVIGGSVDLIADFRNLEIDIGTFLIKFVVHKILRLGGGIYFCRKTDFDSISGFNEDLYAAEDLDFAWRLKKLGNKQGKKYLRCIKNIPIITSSRKFYKVNKIKMIKLMIRFIFSPLKTMREKKHWDILFYGDGLR